MRSAPLGSRAAGFGRRRRITATPAARPAANARTIGERDDHRAHPLSLGAVGHDAHVDARQAAQQPVDQRLGEPAQAAARLRRAHQHVGGAAVARHALDHLGEVLAGLLDQLHAEQRRQATQRLELLALLGASGRGSAGAPSGRRGRRRGAAPSATRGARRAARTAAASPARAGARRRPAARSAPSGGPRAASRPRAGASARRPRRPGAARPRAAPRGSRRGRSR